MQTVLRFINYIVIIVIVVLVLITGFLVVGWPTKTDNVEYGATFSRPYARDDLGLDPDVVLESVLDDLGVRRLRLGAYWKEIQPSQYEWKFEDLDLDIRAVGDRGGKVILAVGEKVPRWPECWGPDWWKKLPRQDQRAQTLRFLETVVRRYRDNPTITSWQIENEPHFSYGDCPKTDPPFFKQEVALVKGLDPTRPVATTDSGELSPWVTFGRTVDQLGVSVYRVVKNPSVGIWRYWFVPPYLYARKGMLAGIFGVKNIYVSEFQMEPWSNDRLPNTPLNDQFKTFDLKQMRTNFHFAERMHISPIDFWGVEWWYWMKEKQGHPEFWEEAKMFYSQN